MALQTENLRLRQQNARAWNEVAHLKEFLSDYGLVWVGEKDKEEQEEEDHVASSAAARTAEIGEAGPPRDDAWKHYGGGLAGIPEEVIALEHGRLVAPSVALVAREVFRPPPSGGQALLCFGL